MLRTTKKSSVRRFVPGLSALASLAALWVAAGAPTYGWF